MRRSSGIIPGLLALLMPFMAWSETMPSLQVENLAEEKLTLPAGTPTRSTLLIMGFTKASREHSREWSRHMQEACTTEKELGCYEVSVIAAVPGLLRGFVAGKIRDGVPEQRHKRFLLVHDHEEEWKRLAGFDEKHEDNAWLLLFDDKGNVLWRSHDSWSQKMQDHLLRRISEPEANRR